MKAAHRCVSLSRAQGGGGDSKAAIKFDRRRYGDDDSESDVDLDGL